MCFVSHLTESFGRFGRLDGKKFRVVTSATIAEERLVVVFRIAVLDFERAKVVVD
jgi:hypothetical protein